MMIATTSTGDVIAIMVFATVLFLIGLGIVTFLKFLVRVIRRKPRPVEPQSVCVYFEMAADWEVNDEDELDETETGEWHEMVEFASYLEAKVRTEQLGDFDGGAVEGNRMALYFYGPDAKRIWESIEGEVQAYAPAKPLEVRFDLGRKTGGREIVNIANEVPHSPKPLPDFVKVTSEAEAVSPTWSMVARIGGWLTVIGFLGLFLNSLGRKLAGVSEREVMDSGFGAFVVFGLSGMFIAGLVLRLIFTCHVQRISKRPSPGPMGRAMQGPVLPRWISNKVILVLVAAVITGVLISLRME